MKDQLLTVFCLIFISTFLYGQRADGKTGVIEYESLELAYQNYDTSFFNNLADSTFEIVDGNNSLRSFQNGLSPILDWHLNKKADLSEYNCWFKNDHFILEIYCLKSCNTKLVYDFLITDEKPQIIFKKGKKNWYKIKRTQNMKLVKETEMNENEKYTVTF